MKKTTQIHIGGRHFTIDEDAYQKLNHYVESLKLHFSREGETGKEIIEDIEQRIAELLENKIINGKQVITLGDVNETINVLGKIEDFEYAGPGEESKTSYEYEPRSEYRRFYRDPDDYYIGGVCGGLAAYFNMDPLWIRLAFALLFFAKGFGLLVYLILWLVVPKARTTAEKLRMKGRPVNLSTIKDSVNEEYQRFRSSEGTAAARTGFENVIRALGLVIVAIFKFIIGVIGVVFLIVGAVFLTALVMGVLGLTNIGHVELWNGFYMNDMHTYFANSTHLWLAIVALILVVLIPVIALIYGGIKILFNVKSKHPVLRVFLLTTWVLALVLFITLMFVNIPNSPVEAEETNSSTIDTGEYPTLVLASKDNLTGKNITHYRVLGYSFRYSKWDDALYDKVTLEIMPSDDDKYYLAVKKKIKNVDMFDSEDYIDEVNYSWEQQDSVLYLNRYFDTDDDEFWLFAKVDLLLRVPEGKGIVIRSDVCDMLIPDQRESYCSEVPAGKKWFMSPDGALLQAN